MTVISNEGCVCWLRRFVHPIADIVEHLVVALKFTWMLPTPSKRWKMEIYAKQDKTFEMLIHLLLDRKSLSKILAIKSGSRFLIIKFSSSFWHLKRSSNCFQPRNGCCQWRHNIPSLHKCIQCQRLLLHHCRNWVRFDFLAFDCIKWTFTSGALHAGSSLSIISLRSSRSSLGNFATKEFSPPTSSMNFLIFKLFRFESKQNFMNFLVHFWGQRKWLQSSFSDINESDSSDWKEKGKLFRGKKSCKRSDNKQKTASSALIILLQPLPFFFPPVLKFAMNHRSRDGKKKPNSREFVFARPKKGEWVIWFGSAPTNRIKKLLKRTTFICNWYRSDANLCWISDVSGFVLRKIWKMFYASRHAIPPPAS